MVQPYQNYSVPQINPYQNNFNQPMPMQNPYMDRLAQLQQYQQGLQQQQINQPKAYRRQYSKNGKDFLECGLWIVSGRLSVQDIICDIPAGNRAGVLRFLQFSIGANQFFWFFAVSACRKKRRAGIPSSRVHPEAVYKVVIRAEGRQVIWTGAADKDSQGNI